MDGIDTPLEIENNEEDIDSEDHHNISFMADLHFRPLLSISTIIVEAVTLAIQRADSLPYHTSILSGHGWVLELCNGHPERICMELGVCKEVFQILLEELRQCSYLHSRFVMLEEQLAIFLYICITGLTIRHVGEHFQ